VQERVVRVTLPISNDQQPPLNVDLTNDPVVEVFQVLDGTTKARVALLTGISPEDIDRLGGISSSRWGRADLRHVAADGKFNCVCGTVIRVSGDIPNPVEWKIMSDVQFDEFQGTVDVEQVYRACGSMFRCETCGRLWIYWNGFDTEPSCYSPEQVD